MHACALGYLHSTVSISLLMTHPSSRVMKVNIGLLFQTGEEQKLLCPHTQKEKKKPQQESMALNLNFSGFECGALPPASSLAVYVEQTFE